MTEAPTVLPPEADPIATLRTMAAFVAEGRGIAEIICGNDVPPPGTPRRSLGFACLGKAPERAPIPIFDVTTRTVVVMLLSEWLQARGYEAAACRWQRHSGMFIPEGGVDWLLLTGPAQVPGLPSDEWPAPLTVAQGRALLAGIGTVNTRSFNSTGTK